MNVLFYKILENKCIKIYFSCVVCSLYLVDPPGYLDDGELPALHGLAQGVDLGQVGVLPHQPVQLRRQLRVVVVVSQLHI